MFKNIVTLDIPKKVNLFRSLRHTFPRKQGKIIEWSAIISLGYKDPLEEVATKIQDFFEQIPSEPVRKNLKIFDF